MPVSVSKEESTVSFPRLVRLAGLVSMFAARTVVSGIAAFLSDGFGLINGVVCGSSPLVWSRRLPPGRFWREVRREQVVALSRTYLYPAVAYACFEALLGCVRRTP